MLIPDDLFGHIFFFLDIEDLVIFSSLCKHLMYLAEEKINRDYLYFLIIKKMGPVLSLDVCDLLIYGESIVNFILKDPPTGISILLTYKEYNKNIHNGIKKKIINFNISGISGISRLYDFGCTIQKVFCIFGKLYVINIKIMKFVHSSDIDGGNIKKITEGSHFDVNNIYIDLENMLIYLYNCYYYNIDDGNILNINIHGIQNKICCYNDERNIFMNFNMMNIMLREYNNLLGKKFAIENENILINNIHNYFVSYKNILVAKYRAQYNNMVALKNSYIMSIYSKILP